MTCYPEAQCKTCLKYTSIPMFCLKRQLLNSASFPASFKHTAFIW